VNILKGGAGNDTFSGGTGADNQQGGAGNDLFLLGAVAEFAAGERITGGDGGDTLRYTGTLPATLSLTNLVTGVEQVQIASVTGDASGIAAINVNAAAVANALAITGNDGNNMLTGTAQADTINGNGGNDTITAARRDNLTGSDGDIFLIAARPSRPLERADHRGDGRTRLSPA
jgi:Ca2+-binding RTX toxin-like protein